MAADRSVCAVGNVFPLANSCTRWRCNFKRLSQHGRQADFFKISAPHSVMTTYRMNLILAGSISLDSTFNINNRTFLKPASGFYSGVTSMLSVTKIGFGGKAKPQVISLKTLWAVVSGVVSCIKNSKTRIHTVNYHFSIYLTHCTLRICLRNNGKILP